MCRVEVRSSPATQRTLDADAWTPARRALEHVGLRGVAADHRQAGMAGERSEVLWCDTSLARCDIETDPAGVAAEALGLRQGCLARHAKALEMSCDGSLDDAGDATAMEAVWSDASTPSQRAEQWLARTDARMRGPTSDSAHA